MLLTMALSVLCQIPISLCPKHHASQPQCDANLTQLLYTIPSIFRGNFYLNVNLGIFRIFTPYSGPRCDSRFACYIRQLRRLISYCDTFDENVLLCYVWTGSVVTVFSADRDRLFCPPTSPRQVSRSTTWFTSSTLASETWIAFCLFMCCHIAVSVLAGWLTSIVTLLALCYLACYRVLSHCWLPCYLANY